MKNKTLLHSFDLMLNIRNNKTSVYLCNRIRTRNEICVYFPRNRFEMSFLSGWTKLRNMSFLIFICKKLNEISKIIDIKNISLHTFKN